MKDALWLVIGRRPVAQAVHDQPGDKLILSDQANRHANHALAYSVDKAAAQGVQVARE
jgi:hypothetical protein